MADQQPQTTETTTAERFSITEWRMELERRKAWLEGYAAGGDYLVGAMIRSRGLSGTWKLSDDLMELVKVAEVQDRT